MRYLLLFIAVFVVLGMAPASSVVNCSGATPVSLSDPFVSAVWNQIMSTRAASGEAAFTWSDQLAVGAAWMAKDAAVHFNTTNTIDSLGRTPRQRQTDCGYRTDAQVIGSVYRTGWQNAVPADAQYVWSQWKNYNTVPGWLYSPAVYPNPTYIYAALGRYRDQYNLDYWVIDVSDKPDSGGPQPTNTPVPPTATPVATATPGNMITLLHCMVFEGSWPNDFSMECDVQ